MTTAAGRPKSAVPANKPGALISPALWCPIDVDELEPAAWEALRAEGSNTVIAGPGAGKTEFLAQRAAYLLQTGLCPAPQRILAISFKRAAAANLGQRVRDRLPDHASRFVSMTFDAFTKNLVDRFRATLPEEWTLHGDYALRFPSVAEQRDFLENLSATAESSMQPALFALPRGNFVTEIIGSHPLPVPIPQETSDSTEFAALAWWKQRYLDPRPQGVDFTMINRLAELLVRNTPHLSRGLALTYPFVFVDEFQDTTYAQYSFLRSIFGSGSTAVTAVGDLNQRIMGWAGALDDAFSEFASDFRAGTYALRYNYRSSPALVDLQHAVAERLSPGSARAISKVAATIEDKPVQLWTFTSEGREATIVADWIAADSASSERTPADYVLVVRQQVARFEDVFGKALGKHGIRIRNDDAQIDEVRLQDLLRDGVAQFLLGVLRLAVAGGQPKVWLEVCNQMSRLRGVSSSDEPTSRVPVDELSSFIGTLRSWLHATPPESASAQEAAQKVLDFVGVDSVRRELTVHKQVEETQRFISAFTTRLATVAETARSWQETVDDYEAADAVSIMTVHRSKSLEYHTVFFLGLDNDQWWAHKKNPEESTATFFVGLSRAAQRTIFTSCIERGGSDNIAEFYSIIKSQNVEQTQWD